MKLLLATRNAGKIRELAAMLADLPVEVVGLADLETEIPEPVEDGDSFAANARIKAEGYGRATEMAVLADDSGIEIDALDGAPGVHSARWAGEPGDDEANNRKMVEELHARGLTSSTARYVCHLVLRFADGELLEVVDTCEGEVRDEARGNGGFGYDPWFYVSSHDRHMAELDPAEKNRISHRGKALRALAAQLRERLER